jgi:hypothetical protein
MIWGWPTENSWILPIGMAGHAFVTTSLLAGSFLYYREADQWAQKSSAKHFYDSIRDLIRFIGLLF